MFGLEDYFSDMISDMISLGAKVTPVSKSPRVTLCAHAVVMKLLLITY